jgi:antitoxin VapB
VQRVANSLGMVYINLVGLYIGDMMGVIIKNPATEAKIRKLAARTGESLTVAIDQAVAERLERLGPPKKKGRVNRQKLAEHLAYFRSLPSINEDLTDEEIVGYDENGVPT